MSKTALLASAHAYLPSFSEPIGGGEQVIFCTKYLLLTLENTGVKEVIEHSCVTLHATTNGPEYAHEHAHTHFCVAAHSTR